MIPIRDYRPSGTVPYVTISLIAINALVFIYQYLILAGQHILVGGHLISGADLFIYSYGLIPREILHMRDLPPYIPYPIWVTLFTSMFIHGGFWHLAGNMLYLWIFGDNVEDSMGHFKFLIFYLLCGLIAAYAQVIIDPDSRVPIVGASGAIAGVLGAYMMLFPYARVLTVVIFFWFIRLVEIPAMILLGFWFIYQLMLAPLGLTGGGGGGVAFFAHIGGFVAGALLVYIFKKRYVQVRLFRRYY